MSEQSGHTPGPWAENGDSVTADFGSVGICILEPIEKFWSGDVNRYPEGKEADANAKLIAAAPELLLLAETFLEEHARYMADDIQLYPERLLSVVLPLAESAVRKAKGDRE